MDVSVQTTKQTTGPEPGHVGPTLSRAHFNSASSHRGPVRDNSLDVITEEQEVLITQVPDSPDPVPHSAPPRLPQPSEDKEEEEEGEKTPPEGVFVQLGDVEEFIEDCDNNTPPTSTPPAQLPRKTGPRAISPLPIKNAVSSDDEDYETDLEYDEEVWLHPEKHDHDVTGRTKYIKVCSDFGVTPVTSFMDSLHEREINLKFYGLSVTSAKALSVPLETNTITEKLNLEGNGIEKEATKFLCRILKENLYITELVLRDNQIGREGAVAVCDLMLQNRNIIKLDLSGNQIEDSCAALFGKVLSSNSSLKQLKLAHNRFEDCGARHFQEAISDNESLELLDLSWNHFGRAGAALLAQGLQENVGLKYFYMPMAGVGTSGCVLVADVLKSNRTVLEFDLSYCRIPVTGIPHIANGLRENDVMQVFKVGSNPFDADCAMTLLRAIEENDSCALKHLDLTNVFVKSEFVDLAAKLQEQRGMTVHYEGVLPAPPKYQRSVAEMVKFRTDPIGHLRSCLDNATASPSEVFHLNGPSKITKQEFTDTVRLAQLDLTADQINILFSKVQVSGLIDIEHLLDLLENPLPEEED